ncbi:MAG: hypothetical protein QF752_13540 [Planctomycetota bacterium]|nr:hypothetical protein [Planctomycetota bacterium]
MSESVQPLPWIRSARFDAALIVGPAFAATALALFGPSFLGLGGDQGAVSPWAWFLVVVGIDVSHVYASLYRTYLDPEEFSRRRVHYLLTPLACWGGGVLLYGAGSWVFWRVLAYLAVYHFLRQQFGFVMVYRHRAGERGAFDRRLDKLTIYSAMLYPLVFWHADPERSFAWFLEGDFVELPLWTARLAVWIYSAILGTFLLRQIQLWVGGKSLNLGKIGIVLSTASVWYVGIVFLNSDFAFTVTNVVAHGVPYIALIWVYGRNKWGRTETGWRRLFRPTGLVYFLGFLLLLGYLEEGLADLLVWHEHGMFFGSLPQVYLSNSMLTLVVPLLTVPQATHYILDAWIWKFDGSNPDLREHLFGGVQSVNSAESGSDTNE